MALLNFDHITLGDRLKVSLSGDHGMNTRGPAGTIVEGLVTELDAERRVVKLDSFLVGVDGSDEVVEHIRVAQEARDHQKIDTVGDS